jgi:hypothetical protein
VGSCSENIVILVNLLIKIQQYFVDAFPG